MDLEEFSETPKDVSWPSEVTSDLDKGQSLVLLQTLGHCEMKSCREMWIPMPGLYILQLLLLLLLTSSDFIASASETLSCSFGVRHSPDVYRRSRGRVDYESAPPGPRLSNGSVSKSPPVRIYVQYWRRMHTGHKFSE